MVALKKQMHGVVSGHGGKALKDSGWPPVGSAVRRRVLRIALELRYQLTERLSIFLGESRDRLAGAIQITPDGNGCAIQERNVHYRIRIDVFQSVIPQTELIIAEQWIRLQPAVHRGTEVLFETRQAHFGG